MHAHPGRSGRRIQEGVKYRPVCDRIATVKHPFSLSPRRCNAAAIEMIPSNPNWPSKFSPGHHSIYQSTKLGSFSESQPAHSGRQPLELHFLLGFTNPSGEALVLRKSGENQFVDLANIFRISGQRSPSERSPALTKHWPDV